MTRTIDLNADVGEASDPGTVEVERALLGLVTTAHVACGGHAGDEESMTETVVAALAHSVRIGAHPSYPDREGFGRRPIEMDRAELCRSLTDQVASLERICRRAGTSVRSVKPHGALYEEVGKGGAVYEAFRDAVRACLGDRATLVLPSGCRATAMALRDGMAAWEEGFCDRAYRPDGGLVDRGAVGSLLDDPERAAAQALGLARGAVAASDGSVLTLWVDTLCTHGDSPGAPAVLSAVRRVLAGARIDVAAPRPA